MSISGLPSSATSGVILYEIFMGAGSFFVFIKGHVFHSFLDLSMLIVMMCVVAFVCLSYKYFCMSVGGRDGSSGALSLRSYLGSCVTVLLVMIFLESMGGFRWVIFLICW